MSLFSSSTSLLHTHTLYSPVERSQPISPTCAVDVPELLGDDFLMAPHVVKALNIDPQSLIGKFLLGRSKQSELPYVDKFSRIPGVPSVIKTAIKTFKSGCLDLQSVQPFTEHEKKVLTQALKKLNRKARAERVCEGKGLSRTELRPIESWWDWGVLKLESLLKAADIIDFFIPNSPFHSILRSSPSHTHHEGEPYRLLDQPPLTDHHQINNFLSSADAVEAYLSRQGVLGLRSDNFIRFKVTPEILQRLASDRQAPRGLRDIYSIYKDITETCGDIVNPYISIISEPNSAPRTAVSMPHIHSEEMYQGPFHAITIQDPRSQPATTRVLMNTPPLHPLYHNEEQTSFISHQRQHYDSMPPNQLVSIHSQHAHFGPSRESLRQLEGHRTLIHLGFFRPELSDDQLYPEAYRLQRP